MKYYVIPPPLSIANYVRFFWVLESDAPYTHRSMACGCPELFFHYNGIFDEILPEQKKERSVTAGIQGPSQHYRRFTINKGFGMFGVYLYPFAISQLFSAPATALTDQLTDLTTFLGNSGKELEEQIMLAADNHERVKIMISFLERRLLKNNSWAPSLFQAIHHIIGCSGNIRISELAGQCFLSARQFERKFRDYAGFSPKLYTRIIRFQAACGEYSQKNKSLTEIAYDCGYYDQSHFINEFKSFSGLHPKAFFSGNTEATSWLDE